MIIGHVSGDTYQVVSHNPYTIHFVGSYFDCLVFIGRTPLDIK